MIAGVSRKSFAIAVIALLVVAAGLPDGAFCSPGVPPDGTVRVYVPVVRRLHPPLPEAPSLFPIDNGDGDGNYTVRWSAAARAETYELQEQHQGGDWFRIYSGSATQIETTNRPPGQYAYRCRAQNSWGDGQWSNLQGVNVQGTPPTEISTPSSSATNAGGKSVVKVVNDCPYALRLEFAGPEPLVMELPKCDVCRVYSFIGPFFCPTEGRPVREIRVAPGEYRVFVSVDNPRVRPFVGHWTLAANRRYSLCFYILSRWTTSESDSGHPSSVLSQEIGRPPS